MIPAHTIITAVAAALTPLVSAAKGSVCVVSTPEHLIETLAVTPVQWRLILMWPGFDSHDSAYASMTTDQLIAVVQGAQGLQVAPGAHIVKGGSGSEPALVHHIEAVSAWVRALRFPTNVGIDPKGYSLTSSSWLTVEGIHTTQHQLNFSLDRALPTHQATIPITIPS